MDVKKLFRNAPWIGKDGNLDPAKFPIDGTLKQALSGDLEQFRSGLNMIGSMCITGVTRRAFSCWDCGWRAATIWSGAA